LLPKYHIIYGFVFTLVLSLFFGIGLLEFILIFTASVLIDVDHYLFYIWKKKDFSLSRAYNDFAQKGKIYLSLTKESRGKYKKGHFIFHGIEFVGILIFLTFYYPIISWILIGIIIHLILDYICLDESPLFKMSQVYVYITNKKKKLSFD